MTIVLPAEGDLTDETVVGWVSLERARAGWADADTMTDLELAQYLAAAYEQCVRFAPALADGAPVPENYRVAQVYQARASWRALSENVQNEMGPEGYTIVTYPLDWTVRQMLRPKRGKPVLR